MRIAMWSGPRNLSTTMMRSFSRRSDCAVWDEPFYAAYLAASGVDHPMREEILAAGETDPAKVAARCAGDAPGGAAVFYQKHMTQHMLPGFPLGWTAACANVFLIRHPARVVASYAAKRAGAKPDDLGYARQAELYETVAAQGAEPLVVDAADIRADPERMLRALCAELGLAFDPAMLSWPAGPAPEDGVWAPHWYGAIHASTGFAGPEGPAPELPAALRPLAEAAMPHYEALRERALR